MSTVLSWSRVCFLLFMSVLSCWICFKSSSIRPYKIIAVTARRRRNPPVACPPRYQLPAPSALSIHEFLSSACYRFADAFERCSCRLTANVRCRSLLTAARITNNILQLQRNSHVRWRSCDYTGVGWPDDRTGIQDDVYAAGPQETAGGRRWQETVDWLSDGFARLPAVGHHVLVVAARRATAIRLRRILHRRRVPCTSSPSLLSSCVPSGWCACLLFTCPINPLFCVDTSVQSEIMRSLNCWLWFLGVPKHLTVRCHITACVDDVCSVRFRVTRSIISAHKYFFLFLSQYAVL